jgi:hypothetical protein
MRANSDLCEVINPGAFPNPAMVADAERPWELYFDSGLDIDAGSYFCAKGSKYETFELRDRK